jgi:hypothetical protein
MLSYDLVPTSCVNCEVKAFNKNLGKQKKKVRKNLSVINVDLDRELYTRHGLHLNLNGKEQRVNKVISVIKDLFHVNKVIPLAMKWKEVEDKDSEQSVNKQMQGVQEIKESCSEKKVLPQEMGVHVYLFLKREKQGR